jgi:hypothetical protein
MKYYISDCTGIYHRFQVISVKMRYFFSMIPIAHEQEQICLLDHNHVFSEYLPAGLPGPTLAVLTYLLAIQS